MDSSSGGANSCSRLHQRLGMLTLDDGGVEKPFISHVASHLRQTFGGKSEPCVLLLWCCGAERRIVICCYIIQWWCLLFSTIDMLSLNGVSHR